MVRNQTIKGEWAGEVMEYVTYEDYAAMQICPNATDRWAKVNEEPGMLVISEEEAPIVVQ